MNNKKRVIAYFDGFNFYEGVKSYGWNYYYWQDLVLFSSLFLRKHQELDFVRYFSAIQHDAEKKENQDKLFQANNVNPKFLLTLGEFKRRHRWKNIECNGCNTKDSYKIPSWEEKKSDVALASYLIRDVALKKCDVVFLFCADSDLTPCLEVVKELNPLLKIICFFPPGLSSFDIKSKATVTYNLENHEDKFIKSLLPKTLTMPNGYELSIPERWKKRLEKHEAKESKKSKK